MPSPPPPSPSPPPPLLPPTAQPARPPAPSPTGQPIRLPAPTLPSSLPTAAPTMRPATGPQPGAAPTAQPAAASVLSAAEADTVSGLAAGAAAGGSIGSAASAGQAGRTNMLLRLIECPVPMRDYENTWAENPTGLRLGFAQYPVRAGAAVGNLIALVGVMAVWGLLSCAVHMGRATKRRSSFLGTLGAMRYPGYGYFALVFIYQPTLEAALGVLWYDNDAGAKLLCFAVAACFLSAALGAPWWATQRHVFKAQWYFDPPLGDDSGCAAAGLDWLRRVCLGPGDYHSPNDHSFVWRLGPLFQDFWPRRRRFMVFELFVTAALSMLDSFELQTAAACKLSLSLVFAVYLVYTAVLAHLRPYHAPINNIAATGTAAMQAAVLSLVLAHLFGGGDDGLLTAAKGLLYVSVMCNVVKAVVDVANVVYDNCGQLRRARAARAAEARRAVHDPDEELIALPSTAHSSPRTHSARRLSPAGRASRRPLSLPHPGGLGSPRAPPAPGRYHSSLPPEPGGRGFAAASMDSLLLSPRPPERRRRPGTVPVT
eukprot:TRINITY_DN9594_c2_g1_i1.p1 TRINITY_DN9594_c2_g1~~TRINITY_DN9594_c2_g1_i1.p1  ORF type:complete len:577 (+),score=122.82 TRINITY_DN9594_c2_g1_i1:109-1731(+)